MSSQNFSIFLSVPTFAFELSFINAFATNSNSSGLKEVERFFSRSFVVAAAFFFFWGFFFLEEAGVGHVVVFVFWDLVATIASNCSRSASVSDSDLPPLEDASDATNSSSDDAGVMFNAGMTNETAASSDVNSEIVANQYNTMTK